jgi:hypothetical protein
MRHPQRLILPLLPLILATPLPAQSLAGSSFRATFGERGLASLVTTDCAVRRFERDGFRITLDGRTWESAALPAPQRRGEPERVVYSWTAGPYRLETVYETHPDWGFLSKRLRVVAAPAASYRVDSVEVLRAELAESPTDVAVPGSVYPERLGTGVYGAALRFGSRGLLAVVQNPFLRFRRDGAAFSLAYAPEMEWRREWGAFASDRGLLAPLALTGRRIPAEMLPEWELGKPEAGTGMDEAEIAAFTEMVRAFLIHPPAKPVDVFVGWTANDYQIDVGTPEGREEYRRLLDVAARVGAEHVHFAPSNSLLSRRVESVDDWSWEHVLWLGLGQKIRRGEWDPRTDEVPPSVREMLDAARERGLGLLAYVYPVLPFEGDSAWLVPSPRDSTRRFASLGVRSFQDWLIEELVAFRRRTGVTGFAFDHTFLHYPGTSRYAQWYGWRRVMEELKRRVPEVVIDGRQAYHLYGPWSWLAGTYPHPTFNDEQPESFVPFPDLHFDRVSADRERWTAWRYRNHEFAPSELVPGYMTHQTPRLDATGDMPHSRVDGDERLERFRARDWDYLGWRYSVVSSIAVGGWNNVIDLIPGRDTAEFRAFSDADAAWLRGWLEWTETNREYLRHTRTILGQPAIGKVDGTSAIVGGRGFLFLFNPNGRRLTAEVPLDATIGLAGEGPFLVTRVEPDSGLHVGKPVEGYWRRGDRLSVEMDGGSALVLRIEPAATARQPVLFGSVGSASLEGGTLRLDGVRGEVGTEQELLALLPAAAAEVRSVTVNGHPVEFTRPAPGRVAARVRFAGEPFHHYQQVGRYDPSFTGGTFRASFTVPERIFRQLAERQKAWPIPWTTEDYRTTWLAPQRLLLFVQIAEPDDRWEARLWIDGRAVELRKAYSSVRPHPRSFVGFYADVSLLAPDVEHTVELELPPLKAGQFQGLFFENVEREEEEF